LFFCFANQSGIILNDCDYDYLHRSKDLLRKRYNRLSLVLIFLEAALVIASTVTDAKPSILVNMILGFGFIVYSLFEKPFLDTNILQFHVTINIYAVLAKGGLLIADYLPNETSHFYSMFLLLMVPFSHVIGKILIQKEKLRKLRNVKEKIHLNYGEDKNIQLDDSLDWFVREELIHYVDKSSDVIPRTNNLTKISLLNMINRMK